MSCILKQGRTMERDTDPGAFFFCCLLRLLTFSTITASHPSSIQREMWCGFYPQYIMLVCLYTFILEHLYPFFCSPLNGISSHKNVLIEFTIITEAAFKSLSYPRYSGSGHVLTVHDKDFNSLSQQRLTFSRTTMVFTEYGFNWICSPFLANKEIVFYCEEY